MDFKDLPTHEIRALVEQMSIELTYVEVKDAPSDLKEVLSGMGDESIAVIRLESGVLNMLIHSKVGDDTNNYVSTVIRYKAMKAFEDEELRPGTAYIVRMIEPKDVVNETSDDVTKQYGELMLRDYFTITQSLDRGIPVACINVSDLTINMSVINIDKALSLISTGANSRAKWVTSVYAYAEDAIRNIQRYRATVPLDHNTDDLYYVCVAPLGGFLSGWEESS